MKLRPPTISLALTIHDRDSVTLDRVKAAIEQNPVDQIVVALDRPVSDYKPWFKGATIVELDGPPGWRCSAAAWNAAFSEVTSELVVCISSDVVMEAGCTTRIAKRLAAYPSVIYGKVIEEDPSVGGQLAKGLTRKVLCSSREPRPLGFIMGLPMWAVRATQGYDEGLMAGIWYEDGDFTQRLWQEGLPFVFDDFVRGTHISHPRPFLDTKEGIRLHNVNMIYMTRKWGCVDPFQRNQANIQYVNSTDAPDEGILYMLQSMHQEIGGLTIGGKLANGVATLDVVR